MATCLVTGGAGFLGSHLCDELLRRGNRVICVDNVETGSLANIAHIRVPEFRFIQADIIEPVLRRRAGRLRLPLREPGVADRLPAAAAAHAEGRLARHAQHARAGQGAPGALPARRRRPRSTAIPKVHPQPESYWGHVNPIGPRGVYDEAKRYAEALTMAYHRQQGVDTAIVRIFNTYGPRMRPHDGRAIPTFLRQALQDRPITVFGDGLADAVVLLRLGPRRRHHPARRVRLPPPGQHRQPERVHAAGARARGDRRDRVALGDRARGAARRRPAGAPAGHHAWRARSSAGSRRSSCARACAGRSRNPASRRSPGRSRRSPSRRASAAAAACTHRLRETPLPVQGCRVDGRATRPCLSTSARRPRSHARSTAARVGLPPTDIRRKRPPALSFLLRLDTLRRSAPGRLAARAGLRRRLRGDLHRADGQGRRCATATWAWHDSFVEAQAERRLRLPRHRAAVRPLRALRRARAAARPAADRLLALPGHASSR